MSYDISLIDPVTRKTIELDTPHHMRGGTYAVGGTKEAWLNITYNYSMWYYKDGVFPNVDGESVGIRVLYDMSGAESIPVLENAINKLKNMKEDEDDLKEIEHSKKCGATGYWLPTKENAMKPLYQLLAFAKMRPDGIWKGD